MIRLFHPASVLLILKYNRLFVAGYSFLHKKSQTYNIDQTLRTSFDWAE